MIKGIHFPQILKNPKCVGIKICEEMMDRTQSRNRQTGNVVGDINMPLSVIDSTNSQKACNE